MPRGRMQSPLIVVALGSLAFLLVACASTSRFQTYAGPTRPAEEVALLRASVEWIRIFSTTDHVTTVMEIDQQAIDFGSADELEIPVGVHKVLFRYERMRMSPLCVPSGCIWYSTRSEPSYSELEFQAGARRHYAAFGFSDSVESRPYLWLTDLDSCVVVAGEPPPLKNPPCKEDWGGIIRGSG
jgi:hypothetical protein